MTAMSVEKKVNGTSVASHAEPRVDPRAAAEAEAIRVETAAKAEALRVEAEGKKALAAQQAEQLRLENEKQALAVERNALRFRREKAVEEAKIAKADAEREETNRAREAARLQAEIDRQVEAQAVEVVEKADRKWRGWAISFYALCAAVALPVQISAFWNPAKPWMAGAPVLLEIAALVVAFGTAAAVANQRPHWHFRLITWVLAFIAASVNLWHGMQQFDPATAIGTALASVFGPGVWDLHEHGRIRKRDGVLTRQERKAAEKETKRLTAEKAAEEERRAAEKEAADKAAEEKLAQLTELRKTHFKKVWEHAEKLAADLGEVDPNAVWERAKLDVDGAKPGESAEVLRMRNAAETRVESARQNRPVSTVSKTTNAQRANQMPRAQRGPARKPPARQPGDTQQYVAAARRQASIAAKNATEKKD